MADTEADTCRRYITPALITAGWDIHIQIAEQRVVAPGQVVVVGTRPGRKAPKRLDYLLRYTKDLPIAVVEAKAEHVPAASGLQQAMDYAETLGLPFAYATNGREIIEHDFLTGEERPIQSFPSPDNLWYRYKIASEITDPVEAILATPFFDDPVREPRYYQTLSVNRAIEALAKGNDRALLTLATGTGKSFIAFQICWRLWISRWNRAGVIRRPRMLYLADRNVLLDQPRLGVFAPFGEASHKISDNVVKSREMYFATYQQISDSSAREGLLSQFPRDFFDLIIVDECHRGSAAENSTWRSSLSYFSSAAQVGMTATPLREETRDTYEYYGSPLIEYSLADGIADGFLAPYKVHRVVTDVDSTGFRPKKGQVDRLGNLIPDRLYDTRDFERTLVLGARIEAMARYITTFLEATDPYAKTIVFCVDQEHALLIRNAIARLCPDRLRDNPDYVCRITSDEGEFGRSRLDKFQDIETTTPVIVTSSDMLTTGVDAPTAKNIVLCRWFGSLSQFKQVVGRGTRLRTDYGKWYFTITDFTGVATVMFADPDFDGYPIATRDTDLSDPPQSEDGDERSGTDETDDSGGRSPRDRLLDDEARDRGSRKFYVDDQPVEIVADVVYHLGEDGRRLSATSLTDYTGEQVRRLARDPSEFKDSRKNGQLRREIVARLEEVGVDLTEVGQAVGAEDSDPFDILCNVAFASPMRSRSERAAFARARSEFWSTYSEAAQDVLGAVLDKYVHHGFEELDLPGALRTPPLSTMGNVVELASRFGGPAQMRTAFEDLQEALYSVA